MHSGLWFVITKENILVNVDLRGNLIPLLQNNSLP